MGLNTSFAIYIKLYIQYHTYIGLTESMTDNKYISIYDIKKKLNNNRKVKKRGELCSFSESPTVLNECLHLIANILSLIFLRVSK